MILRLLAPTRQPVEVPAALAWQLVFDGAHPPRAHEGEPIRFVLAPRGRRPSKPSRACPTSGPDRGAA